MIEVYSEKEDAILVFPNEASLEVFQECGARTFLEIKRHGIKTSKLAASAIRDQS